MIEIVDAAYNNFSVFSFGLESDCNYGWKQFALSSGGGKEQLAKMKRGFDHSLGFWITGEKNILNDISMQVV